MAYVVPLAKFLLTPFLLFRKAILKLDNMSPLEGTRTIVVVGATGKQGGGVVRSLLSSTTASCVRPRPNL